MTISKRIILSLVTTTMIHGSVFSQGLQLRDSGNDLMEGVTRIEPKEINKAFGALSTEKQQNSDLAAIVSNYQAPVREFSTFTNALSNPHFNEMLASSPEAKAELQAFAELFVDQLPLDTINDITLLKQMFKNVIF